MKSSISILAVALAAVHPLGAQAAPTAEEIKQLGTTLTPWGAEKGANEAGTIPAYTGGLTKPPATYDPKRPFLRPDPYPDDKPLYRIDAKNVDKYASKLTPGTIELINKYPTFYIDVYPTRRTAAYPKDVVDATVKNATRCSLTNGGIALDLSKGCRGGIPFPIPKTGYEVMWNQKARYGGQAWVTEVAIDYVKPSGEIINTGTARFYEELGFYDSAKAVPEAQFLVRAEYFKPARLNGMSTLIVDKFDGERASWVYQPSTRRVRLAPDQAADTPIASLGGAATYDDAYLFQGKLDRFDFKLIGKKEIYIPNNLYRFETGAGGCKREEKLTPRHPNPKCMRWELYRVWHVQATLKPGKRHIYSKRDLYLDEDAWFGGISDNYDQSGKLYRVLLNGLTPLYDAPAPGMNVPFYIDVINGTYATFTKRVLDLKAPQEHFKRAESLNAPVLQLPE